ncbi:3-dehydroquinate synthase [Microbacterium paludicola]|uniref:3-dehydroquinate synthase n=1 Tax=Microbacterium paludicola TaxID=300019 RepID=A0A4Y9G022_9MICO|nr:3-dehydroquinate synthase [Microbacterium paludicola]MBF0815376.1 3-dehydroquinate synthase [Microbacterium paludicola]TFU33917.1 3-dehydroquinate synthase [Microbacterium paludicola]
MSETSTQADDRTPGDTVIHVNGTPGYDVTIGHGTIGQVGPALPPAARKVLVVHPPTLGAQAAELREALMADGGREVLLAEIPDAEAGKRIEVAAFCWQIMGQADFTRTDAVVGFGGGAVTDLAGFVAASWLRGVEIVQVPTTVAGMVDAAVGGKTGVNTAEGKNLVGAFWAPRAVICDLDLLATLSENDVLAGFAEIVKAGFIRYPEILDIVEADPDRAIDVASPEFRRCVELAIQMKADVVGEDFREAGLREILNYGHTLGHAIEHAERYRWRHGAAVSVGMMYAAELSRLAGRLSDAAVDRHRRVLELLGLPTTYRAGAWQTLLATMQRDKKARGGMLRFILLDDIAKPTVHQAPDESLLFAAYQEIGAEEQGRIISTRRG